MAFKFVSPGALRASRKPLEQAYASTRATEPDEVARFCRLLCEGTPWLAGYRLSEEDGTGERALAVGRIEGDGSGRLRISRESPRSEGGPPGRSWETAPPDGRETRGSEPEEPFLRLLSYSRQELKRRFAIDRLESRGAVLLELRRRRAPQTEGRFRIRLDRDSVPFEMEWAKPGGRLRLALSFIRRGG